jgi:hypothetical protein
MIRRVSEHPGRGPRGTAETLVAIASDAVASTFAAYGLTLTQAARAGTPPPMASRSLVGLAKVQGLELPTLGAMVSFLGPKVRGDLLIASTFDVVVQTRPGTGRRFTTLKSAAKLIMMRDWTGELANQALGRVKAGLVALGVSFETRAPVPLSAEAMALVTPKAPDTRPVFLRGGGGCVGFWFDVLYDGELDTGGGGGTIPGGSREGNVLLF